jgi:hypothetical protein
MKYLHKMKKYDGLLRFMTRSKVQKRFHYSAIYAPPNSFHSLSVFSNPSQVFSNPGVEEANFL